MPAGERETHEVRPRPDTGAPRPGIGTRLSRRGALGLAGLGTLSALTACSDPSTPAAAPTPSGAPTPAPSGPVADRLTWAQWPDYIDVSGKKRPTLEAFTADTGIEVDYREVINDNAEYVEEVGKRLNAGESIDADVVTLTGWMAARLVRADLMQPIGPLENGGNLISALARPDWDPDQRFSMPWQAGLTGIAYDARRVERAIGSVEELLTRPDLAGRVGMLTEFPDSVGMAMLAQGAEIAAGSAGDVSAAVDYLGELSRAGRFAGFYGNDVMRAFRRGTVDAALAWSGDVIQAQIKNPYLKFVMPEEGLMIWSDNLMVPRASRAASAVARLIDYYYRPEVAATVAAWVNYICPVEGAQEELAKIDPDLAANPLIFPDQSLLDRCYQFPTLPTADDDALRGRFDGFARG
jgi:spermidine/putrescine transport system substrate-binding protein